MTVGQVLMVDLPEEAFLIVLVHFGSVSASVCTRSSFCVFHVWTDGTTKKIYNSLSTVIILICVFKSKDGADVHLNLKGSHMTLNLNLQGCSYNKVDVTSDFRYLCEFKGVYLALKVFSVHGLHIYPNEFFFSIFYSVGELFSIRETLSAIYWT